MPKKQSKASRPPREGDWVLLKTGEKGIVERIMDNGDRLWVRVPSFTDWPWPRWAHVSADKTKRIRPPQPPKPEINTEEALL